MRRGFFGSETPGLMVLPYMVSSLAATSVVGLVVVSTDGTPAGDALGEITGYLIREARGLADPSQGLDESEILGPGPVKAAREQFAHLQPARLKPDDRFGTMADGRTAMCPGQAAAVARPGCRR